MIFAVIDTNVLVSALLSKHLDSSTVIVRNYLLEGCIVPLYNDEILEEYTEVPHRPKLQLPSEQVDIILEAIAKIGIMMERTKSNEVFPDPKDAVFYEVVLSKDGAYLITGNIRHFPKTSIVVSPSEFLEIIGNNELISPEGRSSG